MVLIEPKGYQPVSGAPVIFLAGPIHGAPPWQPQAFDFIRKLDDDVVVATPRRFHSPDHYRWKAPATLGQFHRQRAWERHYMDLASLQGAVIFWLPGPVGSLDGMVYGATTRYEIGLWSSRFSRDPSVGLVVGTDGEFPTVHTIAYDLEHEMPGETVYRTLEETVTVALEVARRNFERWVSRGSADGALECDPQPMTHDELKQTYLFERLVDNPMNDPDQLRDVAIAMLDQQIESRYGTRLDVEELARDPELEKGLAEADGFAELEDLDEPEDLDETREQIHAEMRRSGAWFLNRKLVPGPKYLAIGRSTYYIPFFQRLAVELGTPVYQSDYLEWIEPTRPMVSLAFYLRTAERIDINLEGVSPGDLRDATIDVGRSVAERHELPRPFMTSWEINQIYYTDYDIPVFWHTGGSMSHSEAFEILGARVPKEQIIED